MKARILVLAALLALSPLAASAQSLGGAFVLQDQRGGTVTDQDFAGRFMLLYFGYTFCPDVCPPSLQSMTEVMDLLGEDGANVQPLFVTIDPARDTPQRMAEYLEHFHPRIVGLSGPAPMVAAMAKKYRIKAEKRPSNPNDLDYLMDHTSSMILMGPDGVFADRFGYGMEPAQIAERIRKALAAAKG